MILNECINIYREVKKLQEKMIVLQLGDGVVGSECRNNFILVIKLQFY